MIALVAKVTLVFVAGWFIAALLHRRSAALRHLIWTATLAAAIVLALATPITPQLAVPLSKWPARADRWDRSDTAITDAAAAPARAIRSPRLDPTDRTESTTTIATPSRGPVASLGAIWLAGVLVVLGWCALGRLGLVRLFRRAAPLATGEWQALLDDARARAGVTMPVSLVRSAAVGSPATWGLRRPIVVLPNDALQWSLERRRVVLAHELAHAARGDGIALLISWVACAIYWFHPLAWVAARRLRMEAERAADDHVLVRGTPAVEYAAHLLEVARGSRALRLLGGSAIGMARPSHLEGRLLAILDEGKARRAPNRATTWTGFATATMFALPLAALQPTAPSAPRSLAPSILDARAPTSTAGLSTVDATPRTSVPEPSAVGVRLTTPESKPSTVDSRPATSDFLALVARPDRDSTFEKTITAKPGDELVVDLQPGGLVSIEGWDRPEVQVRARLGGRNWRDTEVELERISGGVRLEARQTVRRQTSTTSHEFDIRVPRRHDVRLESAGGSVTIFDVEGELTGQSGGGDLIIERAFGHADLSTSGGDILVTDSDLSGRVSTGGGSVQLTRVRGGLKGSSGSGPVIHVVGASDKARGSRYDSPVSSINVSGSAGNISGSYRLPLIYVDGISVRYQPIDRRDGEVHISKAGGAILVEQAPNGGSVETGGGEIRIGRSGGLIRATTGGGDITIGPVNGSVEASTGSGTLRVTITGEAGAERVVDLSTGNGSVILDLPRGFSGRFELEAAYTRGRSRSSIETDWDLEESETDRWDGREGTPRKYVRATGVVGSGRGLVRVQIVNGDITIRRGE